MTGRGNFRNGPLGVKPPSDDLATVIVLPSVVDTPVATSCHQMGTGEPILSTWSALSAATVAPTASPDPRPGSGTSGGGSLSAPPRKDVSFCYTAAACLPQWNVVPSIHMRCKTVASLRARATLARFRPRRFATSSAQRFRLENRVTRLSMILAAS